VGEREGEERREERGEMREGEGRGGTEWVFGSIPFNFLENSDNLMFSYPLQSPSATTPTTEQVIHPI